MNDQLQFLFEMYANNHNLTSVPVMKLVKPNMFLIIVGTFKTDISQSGQP